VLIRDAQAIKSIYFVDIQDLTRRSVKGGLKSVRSALSTLQFVRLGPVLMVRRQRNADGRFSLAHRTRHLGKGEHPSSGQLVRTSQTGKLWVGARKSHRTGPAVDWITLVSWREGESTTDKNSTHTTITVDLFPSLE
jgi:hypothetical protein